jgi:hypothetical protein
MALLSINQMPIITLKQHDENGNGKLEMAEFCKYKIKFLKDHVEL